MISKTIGGILLIIGTCVGGGLLALPMSTAPGGFFHALWLFVGIWALTGLSAFFILEANLWFPPGSNMISMAKSTLGIGGEILTWFGYLFLLYALLAAYMAGGTDLVNSLFLHLFHLQTPSWIDTLIFVLVFASLVHAGIQIVDWANRGLMAIKFLAFFLLTGFILPHIHLTNLQSGEFRQLTGAIMVIVTSFGYANIVPSLRSYFNSEVKTLRLVIAIGSLIPLALYILWEMAAQGILPAAGPEGLIHISMASHSVSDLTHALSISVNNPIVFSAANLFTVICITTSFLGVGLCLSDFLADGLKISKTAWKGRWLISTATFLPSLLIIFFYPSAFIKAFQYAGLIAVFVLILLPGFIVFSGRYIKKIAHGYQVWGGPWLLGTQIIIALSLTLYGAWETWG